MNSTVRHLAIVSAVAITVLFTNLGRARLWDRDEPRNAGCTYEMLARGDYVTPVFDGELRTHKPILLYWFMMTAYTLFGVNEFAARFWSAALGVGTAWLTYGLGRRLFSAQVGLWSAIALVTTLMFDVAARAATPDSLLIFWSTAAIYVFVCGTYRRCEIGESSAGPYRWFPSWRMAVLMYAMMGMAVLAKGPVGLVIPTAVIGMYLLIERLPSAVAKNHQQRRGLLGIVMSMLRPFAPRHFCRTCWLMRPLTALAVVLVVALPWYAAVGMRTDGAWIRGFLLDHNLRRAAEPLEGHNGFLLFYPCALLVGLFPWSVFAAPTLLESWYRIRKRDRRLAGYTLAACWIGVYVVLFSLAKTKLPSYVTPCYPGAAMLIAGYIVAWMRGSTVVASFWPRAALVCLGGIGLAMTIAMTWATATYFPGEEWLALLGCIPMLTAVAALGFVQTQAAPRAAITFCTGAVLITTSLFAVAAARIDSHQHFDQFIAAAYRECRSPRLGTLGVLEPSWVFYTRRPMDHLYVPGLHAHEDAIASRQRLTQPDPWQDKPLLDVWDYLNNGDDRFVITTASTLEQLEELPQQVEVISRAPYFLRDDDLVLLARRPQVAARDADGEQAKGLR